MKGSKMSRLDVLETNKALVDYNETIKELIELNDAFLKQEHIRIIDKEKIDPQEWIDIYTEDEVKVEECSCRCK